MTSPAAKTTPGHNPSAPPYVLVTFHEIGPGDAELTGFRILPTDVWETLVARTHEYCMRGPHGLDPNTRLSETGAFALSVGIFQKIVYDDAAIWASKFEAKGLTSAEALMYARHFASVDVAELGAGPGLGAFPVHCEEYADYAQRLKLRANGHAAPGAPLLASEQGGVSPGESNPALLATEKPAGLVTSLWRRFRETF